MKFTILITLVLVLMGCNPTAKFQVRGNYNSKSILDDVNHNRTSSYHCLSELEQNRCDIKNSNIPACTLWDQSIEVFDYDCKKSTNEQYKISIIEFNDEGKVNEQQLNQTIQLLKGLRTQENYKGAKPLVVMFAHGWHHGAQVCDGNLSCFRRALHEIGKKNMSRPIMGIYLGWRGESYRVPKELTLFGRKHIAQRIGKKDGLRALLKIDETVQKNYLSLVTVGHSLGAAMIFTAVQYKMLTEINGKREVRPIGGKKVIQRGFGDLVVLVNPAIEAWEYEPFHNDLRTRIGRPEIITIASKADNAVGIAFPISRVVQFLWRPKNIFRGGSNLKGMGRYDNHITHTLTANQKASINKDIETSNKCGCKYNYQQRGDIKFDFVSKNIPSSDSEFLVIETDETVIGSHNDIYNSNFISFLTQIVNDDFKEFKMN